MDEQNTHILWNYQ